jgi:chromosome segregation ATPase
MKKYLALALLTATGITSLRATDATYTEKDFPTLSQAAASTALSRKQARNARSQGREASASSSSSSSCTVDETSLTPEQFDALTRSVLNVEETRQASDRAGVVLTEVQAAEQRKAQALAALDSTITALTVQEAEQLKELKSLEAELAQDRSNSLQRSESLKRHIAEQNGLAAKLQEKEELVTKRQSASQALETKVSTCETRTKKLQEKFKTTSESLADAKRNRLALAGYSGILGWFFNY